MIRTIRHILEMIRFSHTLFALPFALLAAVMAWTKSYDETFWCANCREAFVSYWWIDLSGIVLCMGFARSAAMAFNRLADREFDATNPRTASRHLPSGVLSVRQVAFFAIMCSLAFVVSTTFFLPNKIPLLLSVPVLLFLLGYSYAKRLTSFVHVWLGAALGLAPVAAWLALRGHAVVARPADLLPAVVLGAAVLTWVAGFDILYACQDYDSDRRAKLHSIPVKFGILGALRIAAACHLLTVCFLALLTVVYPFGWIYLAGVAAVAGLLVYEHLLVRPDDLSRVNVAFFRVNAVISLGLFAVGTLDLLL